MGTGVKGGSGAEERYWSGSPSPHLPAVEVTSGTNEGAAVGEKPFHPLSVGTHHRPGREALVSAVGIPILFWSLYPETCLFLVNPSPTT